VIILDTNIVSVLVTPDHADLAIIQAWMGSSPDQNYRLTAITLGEIAYGVALLPDGARKKRLTEAVAEFFAASSHLTLPFGDAEAMAYGPIMAGRRRLGRPISSLAAQIAAIAQVAEATVATRDAGGFRDCGVAVVNPYAA